MQTFIHYATPPGWRPRRPLPTLTRVRTPLAPALRRGSSGRPQPEPRPRVRPEPDYDGPQDDDRHAMFGLPWQSYLAAALASLVLLLLAVWRMAHGAPADFPAVAAVVGLGLSLWGLADYARAGAAALRAGPR